MKVDHTKTLRTALSRFDIAGDLTGVEAFRRGHIHDTYISTWRNGQGDRRYLHQRINDRVFTDVEGLMHNIETVTRHLESKNGSSAGMHTLRLVPTREASPYLHTPNGSWRTYLFLENTQSFDLCRSEEQAFEAAQAFGRFQAQLIDLDVSDLRVTIPHFFSSPHRLHQLDHARKNAAADRLEQARAELAFVDERRDLVPTIENSMAAGHFPQRVVHGDTKLNNVLFEADSGSAVCVVDLDTCMPAYSLYDFGDLVRFTAATSAEDERDLTEAGTDLHLYRALVNGYLETTSSFLTPTERELMPLAARLVTMTIGMRFLADHLAGDVYFKVHRDGHNLDRARVQFRMVGFMEQHADEMRV